MKTDIEFMTEALRLAETGLGRTAPNPSVGCLIVKDGQIIASARTADGGRPHAETQALTKAGAAVKGATVYVTLEPCSHHGRTLPCTDELIAAQVRKVVIACIDPDRRVAGKGVEALKNAGIETVLGVCEAEAVMLNEGFFRRVQNFRPMITLKVASSLDSKIATLTGTSKWITGEESRARVHEERSRHDAILTGINTVLSDDPLLTTRIDGIEHHSRRVILDTHLRMPANAGMIGTLGQGAITILTGPAHDTERRKMLEDKGVKVMPLDLSTNGKVSVPFAMEYLANEGITRLMVEGGQAITSAFVKMKLWDWMLLFRAPIIIGREGMDAFGEIEQSLDKAPRLQLVGHELYGNDALEIYRKD